MLRILHNGVLAALVLAAADVYKIKFDSTLQAERVANKIDAGMVYVNLVGADGAELPFGGVKRSGSGRELGRYGADEFVNKKLIRIS